MLYTKLLLRRLACVSWLLASGLVLGWSGKAAAQDATISLTVDPTVISEDAGATDVVVTATLDGKVFDQDVVVYLVSDDASTALRDVDYTAALSPLTISAGSASGKTTITISPYNDKRARGDKTIRLKGVYDNNAVGTVDITLKDVGASSVLSFDENAAIANQTYIVGRAITAWLPEAFGGTGNLTYSVSSLPAGLSFDASTRTISGTPTAATDGAVKVTYRVTDESGATITRTFTITIVNGVGDATVSLKVSPSVISEDAGATDVVVTATLDGKVFDEDAVVFLSIDNEENIDKAAVRDLDYDARLSLLVIPAGSVSGTTTITIIPHNDKRVEGEETIRLTAAYANTVVPVDITLKDAGGGSSFSFSSNAVIDDQTYAAGTEITPIVLPEASGGTGELTYSVSALPAGLSFDASTRTLSGTPTAAIDGAVVTYTATDESGATDALTFTITIVTDDANIVTDGDAKILLTVDPTAISEDAGATDVVVIGTLDGLDGKVFDDDVVMLLTFDEDINGDGEVNDDDKAAVLNVDYVAELRLLAIPPGSVSGTTTITITPINDKKVEGDETIRLRLRGSHANNRVTGRDAEGDDVKMTVVPVDITLQDTGEGGASFFAADAAIDDGVFTTGVAITDLVLPEASGGTGDLTYGVSGLPAGLTFDASTRTLSGTPTAVTNGAVTVIYTATDEDGTTDTLTFTIRVNPLLGDAFDLLFPSSEEAGVTESEESEEPSLAFADDAVIDDQVYTAEWPIVDLVLPEASGGTGELTYSVSALPTGLSFDASTRTISGTPTEVTDGAVTIVYTVIDEEENADALTFTITVNEELDFGNLFDLFGAGKVVPTTSRD